MEHGVEVRERDRRADRDRHHVRQELAAALLDHAPLRRARLPLAARGLERDEAERARRAACRRSATVPVRLPSTCGGGDLVASASSASELPTAFGLRRRGGVDLDRRRGHARRRALAKRRRERRERIGTDEQLGASRTAARRGSCCRRRARRLPCRAGPRPRASAAAFSPAGVSLPRRRRRCRRCGRRPRSSRSLARCLARLAVVVAVFELARGRREACSLPHASHHGNSSTSQIASARIVRQSARPDLALADRTA